jgi:hypothetical protein
MERADVGMIQRGDRARFALEALAEIRIRCDMRRQDFDRHGALEPRVDGSVDLSHTPGTD